MSDSQQEHQHQEEKPFSIEISKKTRAHCKRCTRKCVQGELRIAKLIASSPGSVKLKVWYHVDCIFDTFIKQRYTTRRIEGSDDIDGWDDLMAADQNYILQKIDDCNREIEAKMNAKNMKNKSNKTLLNNKSKSNVTEDEDDGSGDIDLKEKSITISDDNLSEISEVGSTTSQDNLFREFRIIVAEITKIKLPQEKIKIFSNMFKKGTDGHGFKGDLQLWVKLLLPTLDKRVFNLQSKQLTKFFSKIFNIEHETMLESLEQGDIGFTIQYFFERNDQIQPATKSTLTLQEIDEFLEKLARLHKEEEQIHHIESILHRCTGNDLKVLIRLIVHDLRMKAGVKHVLEAICPELYQCYQICKDLNVSLDIWKKGNAEFYILEHSKAISSSSLSLITSKKRSNDLIKSKKPTNKRKFHNNDDDNNNNNNNNNRKKRIIECKTTSFDDLELVACNYQDDQLERRTFIPNYFANVKLLLEDGISERYSELIRYFIAYGGIVLNTNDYMDATHVLHLKDTTNEPYLKCPKNARHIIIEWIKHTVEKECLQDNRPYTVRWKPVID